MLLYKFLRENYFLKRYFSFKKESFIKGNLVKRLVRPILGINDDIYVINF